MTSGFDNKILMKFQVVFILQFWLNTLFLLKTESLVNLLSRSQSELHKLYYTNHRKTKAILAYWICMGYGRHCSVLQARTNPYSTYTLLESSSIPPYRTLWNKKNYSISERHSWDRQAEGQSVSRQGHPAPSGTPQGSQPITQYHTLPHMQVNCHH